MALASTTVKSLSCSGCRQWALRTFIASIGGPSMHFTPPQHRLVPRQTFTTNSARWNEAREHLQKAEKEEASTPAFEDMVDEHSVPENTTQSTATSAEAHVPWYLQVEPSIPPQENVLSARQKIPDLPEHPPQILKPLLQHVSVELGMDDLSLLDLRGIDPPPALGANLIMIVGTARSEKHLHFSADKLCRWLRSEHRLTPYADGLLGRQELKLKMRRRAKRSRLLSAVGAKATADTELDEGIRTGWICINLGKVEGGELAKTEEERDSERNVVGFGTGMTGSNIVIQLLTEDKRGEMELERLWMAVLKKTRQEKEALLAKDEEAEQAETSTDSSSTQQPKVSGSPAPQTYTPMDSSSTSRRESTV